MPPNHRTYKTSARRKLAINLRNTYDTFGRDSDKARDVEASLRDVFLELHRAENAASSKPSEQELDDSVRNLGDLLGKVDIGGS